MYNLIEFNFLFSIVMSWLSWDDKLLTTKFEVSLLINLDRKNSLIKTKLSQEVMMISFLRNVVINQSWYLRPSVFDFNTWRILALSFFFLLIVAFGKHRYLCTRELKYKYSWFFDGFSIVNQYVRDRYRRSNSVRHEEFDTSQEIIHDKNVHIFIVIISSNWSIDGMTNARYFSSELKDLIGSVL